MKEISCEVNKDAYIRMLPVCGCGYVFTNLAYSRQASTCKCGKKVYSLPSEGFNINFCPQCGKRITSVLCPGLKEDGGILKFFI